MVNHLGETHPTSLAEPRSPGGLPVDLIRYSIRAALVCASASLLGAAALDAAQAQAPPAAATSAPAVTSTSTVPPSPVTGIRNKLAAGDLLSAESIAEAWRVQHGADSPWLSGYAWLARGALMLGEPVKAKLYADSAYLYCKQRVAAGADLELDGPLETALGAAIEVKAQLIERTRGRAAATNFVRAEIAKLKGPASLLSRLQKRANMISLIGERAPELVFEEPSANTPTLRSLIGRPVLLFLFNPTCGDCRAQEPTLEALRARHLKDGLQVIAVTRWYDEPKGRAAEKAVLDSVWATTYKGFDSTPVVVSTASMLRYGGSSTPTFVFIDRAGIVRGYTPTRLTEAEFERRVAAIMR
jgi:thiol-disulfide isomerase/thioredoxin